jgi:hypothetical protein
VDWVDGDVVDGPDVCYFIDFFVAVALEGVEFAEPY